MRTFLVLLEREMKSYFYSPIAYIVLCFFLALTGYNAYVVTTLLNKGPAEITMIEGFFGIAIFWFGFIPMIPLITMRLYSEEFKLGTIETLMTAPVEDWQVVLHKFAGALLFYVVLWAPTTLYFAIFQYVTGQPAAQSVGSFVGSYAMLLLMGAFYVSLGCLASVITRNQIIAAIIALVLVVMVFFTGVIATRTGTATQAFRDFVAYFSSYEHLSGYSRGLIDTRPIVYYLSMTALLQFLTYHIFQFRKWKA